MLSSGVVSIPVTGYNYWAILWMLWANDKCCWWHSSMHPIKAGKYQYQ